MAHPLPLTGSGAVDAAIVIGGGFIVVLAVCAVMGRKAWARIGQMEIGIESIDNAVNHRKMGQPKLIDQVDRIVEKVDSQNKALTQRLDVVDERLKTVDRRQASCEDRLTSIAERLK